jgi:hypothetical protein
MMLIEEPLATLIDLLRGSIESNDSKLLQMWFLEPESTNQSLQLIGWSRVIAYFETVAVRLYSQSLSRTQSIVDRRCVNRRAKARSIGSPKYEDLKLRKKKKSSGRRTTLKQSPGHMLR